jgi:Fungal Zn(2)-Cys(6) binuclear cluster domain
MADSAGPQQGVQKRARQQLSCTACRAGKLRCNRQSPCDQCVKRSKAPTCQYLPPPMKKKKSRNTRDRIAHLEGLVVQLMHQNNRSEGSVSTAEPRISPRDYLALAQQNEERGHLNRRSESTSQSPATSMSTSDASSNGTAPSAPQKKDGSVEVNTRAVGQLKISNGETCYIGSAHWEAILENVGLDENQLCTPKLTRSRSPR